MRLVRFVQFAIGVAAASGGAVVVLSGSALAAESSSLGTTSQTTSTTQTVVRHQTNDQVTTSSVDPADSANSDSTGTAAADNSGSNPSTVGASGTAAPTESAGGQTSDSTLTTTTSSKTDTNSAISGGVTNKPAVQPVTTSEASASSPAATSTSTQPASSDTTTPATASAVSNATTTDPQLTSAQTAIPEVAVKTPVAQSQGQTVPAPEVFQTTILPIQPTITNRLPFTEDLAPAAPSAPGPARAPTPAKSNGMLGGLTAELAAITVPQPLVLHTTIIPRPAVAAGLTALAVLLFDIFVSSYGLWLRRGGFATAARSDTPTSQGSPSIATPFLLGYVELPPQPHNPIFMVVGMVPNALKKGGYAMKSMRILGVTTASCSLALVLAGSALADSNAVITDTGADSTQAIKVENTVDYSNTNLNVTSVSNGNTQVAVSGDVSASKNTNVGGTGSGNAANNNGTTTQINTSNQAPSVVVPSATASGQGGANCGCKTVSGVTKPVGGVGSGSVLGAATVAPAILPVTGALVPVDVSALRAAWQAPSAAPTASLVKATNGLSTGMLGVAALLSLLGGLGSALYGRRNERRV